jgi:hypothetical protein
MKQWNLSQPLCIARVLPRMLLLFAMGQGCNVGSYPDLGSKLDPLTSIGDQGAAAWMRTATDGHSDFFVFGNSPAQGERRFIFVTMMRDCTGSMQAGTFEVQDDKIILKMESEYTKTLELDVPPSSREGSVRVDYSPPREIIWSAFIQNGLLHVSGEDGERMVMTDLWDVIPTIDVSSDAGVDMLVRLYNVTTVSLQMRIPGFGGAGLLQYSGEPSEFVGVIDGASSIEMTSVFSPVVEIAFADYKDYPGIVIDGKQVSSTDMKGDGTVTGPMHFAMADPREGGVFRIEGDLTYQITLKNGTSSDGGVDVTLSTGKKRLVPWYEGENLDFRSVLPPN